MDSSIQADQVKLKKQQTFPTFSMAEVALHRSEEDGWFVYEENVYNASPHLKEIKKLKTSTFLAVLRVLGTDCTEEVIHTNPRKDDPKRPVALTLTQSLTLTLILILILILILVQL